MTQEELFQMIISLPPKFKFDEDTVHNFIMEHMLCDDNPYHQFESEKKVLEWLVFGDSFWPSEQNYGWNEEESKSIKRQATMTKLTLKPGTKIIIRKPSANIMKFNDIESAQAYLQSQTSNIHSNDDSDQINANTFGMFYRVLHSLKSRIAYMRLTIVIAASIEIFLHKVKKILPAFLLKMKQT